MVTVARVFRNPGLQPATSLPDKVWSDIAAGSIDKHAHRLAGGVAMIPTLHLRFCRGGICHVAAPCGEVRRPWARESRRARGRRHRSRCAIALSQGLACEFKRVAPAASLTLGEVL